ncbi:MAG: sensor histidine kinase [Parvularculaceae bacterium]
MATAAARSRIALVAEVNDFRAADDACADKTAPHAFGERVIHRSTATFSDPALEDEYRNYLSLEAFRREFYLQWVGVAAFLSYGFLDLLTGGDEAVEFLFLRCLVVGPIGALGVTLTSVRSLRRYQQYSTIIGFALYCSTIIYMISAMPIDGAPYIIGVLVTMIFTSCFMRVNFRVAAFSYLFVSALYCGVMATHAEAAATDRIAGYFFMISVAAVAIVTSYAQEIRAREIWFRNRQREKDAAEIRRLLVEATAADQSKINFLSVLTHELRTPLHQIIGFSEIAQAEAKNACSSVDTSNVDHVLESARRLLKKISQMLRYADATAGKLSFVIDDVPVREIVDQLLDQYAQLAAGKAVKFVTDDIVPAMLLIDPHHTAYALGNLVDNALNASPRNATIVISGAPVENGNYQLLICDQGGGMSPEKIAAAFEPFVQGEAVYSRSQEGLGLGLSIAKQLIERQGGSLRIKSAVGAGTTVEITCSVATRRATQAGL